MNFYLPTRIVSTYNVLENLDFSKMNKVLIVSDPVMIKLGVCDVFIQKFSELNISCEIFSDIEPDPSFATVVKGVRVITEYNPDTLIAVGGGSVIDTAKAFIYFDLQILRKEGKGEKPFFIAVPTTSGTGSEVTAYAVITDTENHVKIPIKSDDLFPDLALLDPHFTLTVPPRVTADTGMDVLTHAVESFVSTGACPFSKSHADYVVKMVFRNLPVCYFYGGNLEARLAMHEASCMAGAAFNNSGLGLVHAMAHALGARFKVPHGRSNAILLPYVLKFNAARAYLGYARLGRTIGLAKGDPIKESQAFIAAVEELNRTLEVPSNVREAAIDPVEYEKSIPLMASQAMSDICLQTNPTPVTPKDIEKIYAELL